MEIQHNQAEIIGESSQSGYGHYLNGEFVSAYPAGNPMHEFHLMSHSYLHSLVENPAFACIGAKKTLERSSYAFCAYDDMTAPETAAALQKDITTYMDEFNFSALHSEKKPTFVSFIAAFKSPAMVGQLERRSSFLYVAQKSSCC
jgi:FPC/CPF motif-containing protein YcgG